MNILRAAALAAAMTLGACAPQAIVLGHCELPDALSAPLAYLDPIPTDKPIPRADADAIWAKDRAHDAQAVTHNNAVVGYVKGNCQ